MDINERHKRLIDESTSIIPPAALEKYRKFIDDLLRGVRDPDEDTVRRAVWEASMRYADPR
jgi:hypothetical protein